MKSEKTTCYMYFGLLVFLLLNSPVDGQKFQSQQEFESRIDRFVTNVLGCTDVPGLAIAVLNDGQPFLAKGYGFKDLNFDDPVTNKTMFNLASVTKHMAGALTGMVLEDHGFSWDSPVRNILGDDFHLSDPYRTLKINVKDMLSHRSGMYGHNYIRIHGYSRDEFIRRLEYLPMSMEFRDKYLYMNIMYGLATYAAETLEGGTPWEELFEEKLLSPLGMDATTFIQLAEDRWDEFAHGHQTSSGQPREVSFEVPKIYYSTVSSMGGVASNAEDMLKWMYALMNDGQNPDGEQVIPQSVLESMQVPVTVDAFGGEGIRSPEYPVAWSNEKYAMGLRVGVYRGYELLGHTGNQAGIRTRLTFLRDMKHGVFIAMNRSPDRQLRVFLNMFVFDLLLGLEPWLSEDNICDFFPRNKAELDAALERLPEDYRDIILHGLEDREVADIREDVQVVREEDVEEIAIEHDLRQCIGKCRKELAEYSGTFGHYAYGNLTFSLDEEDDEALLMIYGPTARWRLTQVGQTDAFSGRGLEPFWFDTQTATFDRNDEEEITGVTVTFEPAENPRFVRDIDWSSPPPPPQLCPQQ